MSLTLVICSCISCMWTLSEVINLSSGDWIITSSFQFDLSQDIVNSDDSVNDASPLEDSDASSSTIKSTQDNSAKPNQPETQLPVIDSNNDDTFTAHVIIEQALHLPTVPGSNGERYHERFSWHIQ